MNLSILFKFEFLNSHLFLSLKPYEIDNTSHCEVVERVRFAVKIILLFCLKSILEKRNVSLIIFLSIQIFGVFSLHLFFCCVFKYMLTTFFMIFCYLILLIDFHSFYIYFWQSQVIFENYVIFEFLATVHTWQQLYT